MNKARRWLARIPAVNFIRYAAGGRVSWPYALRGMRISRRVRLPTDFDADIFRSLLINDEYRLRGRFLAPSDVVVDIGGHQGYFGLLAYLLGSRRIVSYEAHPANATIMAANYRRWPGTRAVQAAVTRSDTAVEPVRHSGFAPGGNTGGGNVIFDGRLFETLEQSVLPIRNAALPQARTIALDEILREYDRVRLLKLDCEGSEFPILLTSEHLDRVDEIVGEYHQINATAYPSLHPSAQIAGYTEYRVGKLTARLRRFGFQVETTAAAPSLGHFWARRRS